MLRVWLAALLLILPGWAAFAGPAPNLPANVDGARIRAADKEPGQWMSWGRTYDEQRFSPLGQINQANVGQLGLAWFSELDTFRGVEGTPLAIDGVLYNTSAWNITTAYDGATGKVLWRYDPKVPPQFGRLACCDIVSRGLAAWKGRIIIATLDGRLIALDAKTGQPAWSVNTFEGEPPWPYTVTGAPRVFDGKVLIGNGGAELGVRGYVTAYDAASGKKLWRFYTVPGDPSKGFENKAMEMAAKTWTGEWWKQGGGGTAWDSIVYDPKLKLIYIGAGNGSPWVQKFRSPGGGDNLFLASIVAVKADTGDYVWHYQLAPGEQWDSTATQPMMLADLKIGGRLRHVLMQAPKNGFFYVLDRTNGKLISAKAFAPVNWAKGIDPKTGRPIETAEARYGEQPVLLSPGPGGAHNYNPMSFSPKTGLVYFPVVQSFWSYNAPASFNGRGNGLGFGGDAELRRQQAQYADAHTGAWLVAWDPVRQREVWRVDHGRDGSGGTLATAGGLVFEGTIRKTFAAYRASDGRKLWETEAQSVPVAGPITYTVKGVQYVAVNAGWGGGLSHVQANAFRDLNVSSARLLVFKLGGQAKLPPAKPGDIRPPQPPQGRAPEAVVAKGGELYAAHCALCHGTLARGGIKDLRHMTPETHRDFLAIVMDGSRKSAGMASFADVLGKEDAEAIHGYLIARANEDWGEDKRLAGEKK
jgi:quinohemoprotein ethanol dehydrogenase